MKTTIMRVSSGLVAAVLSAAIGFSSVHAQTSKQDVRAALQQAGMSALPEFLDAATDSITIKFPKVLGGGALTFGGTIDAQALTEKKFVFATSDDHKIQWNDAFGLTFLDLKGVALNLSVERGAFDISLAGGLGGVFQKGGKDLDVLIRIAVKDGRLQDFTLALPDARMSLASIPELKNIPGAAKFAISAPVVSMNAIGGKIDFLNETTDAVVFFDAAKREWNVGLRFEKPLTLAELTGHKRGFLQHLGLPKMQLLASTNGLSAKYADLPLAAQNFFTSDGKLPAGTLTLVQGVNVLAEFDPAVAPADVKKALATIGLGQTALRIDGTVEGMFGGSPSVELNAQIDSPAGHGFKFLRSKQANVEFFIKLSKDESGLGFKTVVEMNQGGASPLEFDVSFGLVDKATAVEVQVSGAMKGDWHNAAGIKGLILTNPFMSVGVSEAGSFDMLIDGTVQVGSEKIRAVADMVLSPEAAGLPTAIAFAGKLNKLAFDDLVAIAKKHAAQKGGGFKGLNAELKDIAFAFMTPGASLPADLEHELSIEGAGMALKATLLVNNKELGSAKGYASTDGMSFDGKIAPFKLGPLDLKDATLSIKAGPSVDPKFAMTGNIALFKGFDEAYVLELQPSKFTFSSDTKFGGAFDATLVAESDGLSFSPANDFAFEATLAANYTKIFRDLVQDALKGLKKADQDIKKAEDDVKAAERKVAGINTKIQAAKEKAQRAYNEASKQIGNAEKKVDSINKTISYNNRKAHDLDRKAKEEAKHLKLAEAAKTGSELAAVKSAIAAEEAALKTAKWALETAKKSVKAVPADAAPEVVALKTQLATEEAGLKVAQGALAAARGADEGVEAAVKAVANDVTALKINKIGAAGSIKGIVSGGKEGKRPVLIIDVTIHGANHVYREPLEPTKNEFKQLAGDIAKETANAVLKAFTKK